MKLFFPFLLTLTILVADDRLFAQGTAFTYQGRLNDGGNPANGTYDLSFTLFTVMSNGAPIAGTVPVPGASVSNGLFTVMLDFGNVFDGNPRWLEIGVRTNGAAAFVTLSPRQPLTPSPYAITAGSANGVAAGVVTAASIAPGSIGTAQIASNAITAGQLVAGAAAANLSGSGQAGVASGGLILSPTENTALVNAGYVKIGSTVLNDDWMLETNNVVPPIARFEHLAVWTGTEMIVWGGVTDFGLAIDGGRYNPAANSWTIMTTNGAPTGRRYETVVWTGTEMIIWGGFSFNNGGRYNPVSDSWKAVTTNGAPMGRSLHTAVWTGSEMIVWGGIHEAYYDLILNDGARYNPSNDSWIAVTTSGAPTGRFDHTAVWTGTEMIVWGGTTDVSAGVHLSDGGRYNPSIDSWKAVTTQGKPAGRFYHTAVWTGIEMIIWGGTADIFSSGLTDGGRYNPSGDSWMAVNINGAPPAGNYDAVWTGNEMLLWGGSAPNGAIAAIAGGRYNPVGDSWTPVNTKGAPSARDSFTAVWTGGEMIVWGGFYYFTDLNLNDGGRYNPAVDSWTAMTGTAGAPAPRGHQTAVWTGSEMIVWGGASSHFFSDGGRYNPAANSWAAVTTGSAPSARQWHTAIWTGNQMIVWGGYNSNFLNDGGSYNPTADNWTAVPMSGAPAVRAGHTAVWTGNDMIVWGGNNNSSYLNDGGRYNPASSNWTAVAGIGAPSARAGHTAVWTGSRMLIWGGNGGGYLNDGGGYNPSSNSWTALSSSGAPSARVGHTAVWTGNDMIVWGGNNASYLNDGGRYNPAGNSWTALTTTGAPDGRYAHTAVWTGTEMIVWGGFNGSYLNTGGRYLPSDDTWKPVTTNCAPAGRQWHTAVWTGNQMLVWGGGNGTNLYNDTWSYTPGKVMFLYEKP